MDHQIKLIHMPLPEDGRAHPDEGTAFFDGQGVIIRHPHADFVEVGVVGKITVFQKLKYGLQVPEFGSDKAGIAGEGGHAHDAANPDILHCGIIRALKQFGGFGPVEAKFGFFGCNMKLKQAGNAAFMLKGLAVDLGKEFQAVDRMDHVNERRNVFYLIGLQMADEMPFHILRQLLPFGGHFPGFILTEDVMPGIVSLENKFWRMGFGHGDQPDPFGQTAAYLMYVFGY